MKDSKAKCVYGIKKTKHGYINIISGCRIEMGRLATGWVYCPYCGNKIDRSYVNDK